MKTSKEIAQAYINQYPKIENDNEYFITYYKGNKGNKIKGKELKCLNFFMEENYLDTLFIDSKEKEFWDKFNNSTESKIYIWKSSILFDFGDKFYYELASLDERIINHPFVKNNKIIIAKTNIELQKIETDFEVDIIIL
ncbi:hypothetical protein GW796_00035 [archaeon]|nr:hypothetical protein [archaeon]